MGEENTDGDDRPSSSTFNDTAAEKQPQLCIWSSKKKPTEQDNNATKYFLELRAEYAAKFNDKKTHKQTIWQEIANKLKQKGFDLGSGGAEKCRQKFWEHVQTTGKEKMNPPPFYEELHSILGNCFVYLLIYLSNT